MKQYSILKDGQEIWKPIAEYEGFYSVSSLGRVRREKTVNNTYAGRILHGGIDCRGYHLVLLYKNGVKKSFKTHRLVASAFINNLQNLPQVNHKDGIKTNNRLNNLEYVSAQRNRLHAFEIGLQKGNCGESNPMARMKEKDVLAIRKIYSGGGRTYTSIAKDFNLSIRQTIDIIKRKSWSNL